MSRLADRAATLARLWTGDQNALAPAERSLHLAAVVGILGFLAVLVLLLALAASGTAARWSAGLAGALTVELPAGADPAQIAHAVEALSAADGVARAQPLAPEQVRRLVEPWLGAAAASPDLPLPVLIDVALVPGATADAQALSARLAAVAPEARIDDHRRWLAGARRVAGLVLAIGLAAVALVALAAAGAVAFATRAALAGQQQAIELLHLMGARDGAIAWHFTRSALGRCALGAGIGALLAAATVAGLAAAARAVDPSLNALAGPGIAQIAAAAALTLGLIAAAGAATWLTVMHALKKML